jgi:fructose-1,6-bisphosphatase
VRAALTSNVDIASAHEELIDDTRDCPVRVADTDRGKRIQARVDDLTHLLEAYREGSLQERGHQLR